MNTYYVYILTNKRNGTLYTGITNDIEKRIQEHKNKVNPLSFSSQYHTTNLVWYESFPGSITAIAREKQIKGWRREWKIKLIEESNPQWLDRATSLKPLGPGSSPG